MFAVPICMTDRAELLRELISTGAVINSDMEEVSSPLYDVVSTLNVDKNDMKQDILPLVSMLLQNGADPNFVYNKKLDYIKRMIVLQQLGLHDSSVVVEDVRQPLVVAAIKFSDSTVLQALIDAGVKLDHLEACPLTACMETKGKLY